MFNFALVVLHLNVRERICLGVVANQHRVALRIVACARRLGIDLDQAAIAVLRITGGNALGNDRAFGVLANVNHLAACVGLLVVIGQRHRVKLTHGVIAHQHAAWIFPSDR